jgi:succinoglycan biosynthesis protein ExoL
LSAAGHQVWMVGPERDDFDDPTVVGGIAVPLGRAANGRYWDRIAAFASYNGRIGQVAREVQPDLIWTNGLDLLAHAVVLRRRTGLKTPIVYDVPDLMPVQTRAGSLAAAVRRIERALLSDVELLSVTSEGFLTGYYDPLLAGSRRKPRFMLVENKLPPNTPWIDRTSAGEGRALRVVWAGLLRCNRSVELVAAIASALPDRVEFHLHGYGRGEMDGLVRGLADTHPNVHYHGPYNSVTDFGRVFGPADLAWCFDFADDVNSRLLMPVRYYSALYAGLPMLARRDTVVGDRIDRQAFGFTFADPTAGELISWFRTACNEMLNTHKGRFTDASRRTALASGEVADAADATCRSR